MKPPAPRSPANRDDVDSTTGDDLQRELARGTLELTPFVLVLVVAGVVAVIVLLVSAILWGILSLV